MTYVERLRQLAPPLLLIVVIGLVGNIVSESTQTEVIGVLVNMTIVISLYVFIGNSGIISFGQISFVAIGAFAAGVMTIPSIVKPTLLPELFPFIADNSVTSFESLILAMVLGAIIAAVVAFGYQHSRSGRLLRASREDPIAARALGVNIHRHRLIAFSLSGALAALAGGLLVHQLGSITTEQVYLQLTFITLAMLVVGGSNSLWGATVGGALISILNVYLQKAEAGASLGPLHLNFPNGMTLLIIGVVMTAILVLRPQGLTGGRELTLWLPRRGRRAE
jgi:ABC-type branched-subunit amino acid transport system permease subunit